MWRLYPSLLGYYAGPHTVEARMGLGWTWSDRAEEEDGSQGSQTAL